MANRIKKQAIRRILSSLKKPKETQEYKKEQSQADDELQQITYKGQQSEEDEDNLRMSFPEDITQEISPQKDVLSEIRDIDEKYNLHYIQWQNTSIPITSTNVKYDVKRGQLQYFLNEPKTDKRLSKIIERTISELHDRLEIDYEDLKKGSKIYEHINKKIAEIWEILGVKLNPTDAIKVKYYVFRDAIGLGRIDSLMKDPNIEDISCDGIGLPIYVYHRNPQYGEIETNISFNNKQELDSFAMKLAQKCGRTISVASPLMDGSLQDGSRVQITYGTDIARRGTNFTIRKFFRVPLTPIDLINFGTASPLMLAYLWIAIEKEKSILISGTTATGKTTLLNALSLFIEPNMKIVSIEDTREIQLPHINWMPQVTRAGFGSTEYGKIGMYSLLKAALRQRPDYLIVGEVRGEEANVLFQAMATGHPGISTIHADTVEAVMDRLTTRPINLPISLLENLDILLFIEKSKRGDSLIRRIGKLIEIEGYDAQKKDLLKNTIFEWDSSKDAFSRGNSKILQDMATHTNLTKEEVQEELIRRAKVLNWMYENSIYRFPDVAKVINLYYSDPKKLEKMMEKSG